MLDQDGYGFLSQPYETISSARAIRRRERKMEILDSIAAQLLGQLGHAERKEAIASLRRIIDEESCRLAEEEAGAGGLACPRCGSLSFVRRGRDAAGAQRCLCKDCGRSFNGSARKVLAASKLGRPAWMRFAECFVDRRPLRECAEECGVSLKTAFFMRHRVLEALAKRTPAFRVGPGCGAEVDESYFRESFKGNHTNSAFDMPRPPRRHGRKAPNAEQICVMTGINDANDIFYALAGRGISTSREKLERTLGGVVCVGAVVATDGANAFGEFLREAGVAAHVVCPAKGHELNRVNGMHSRMKEFFRPFHGVSTKHLHSYLAWFKWVWSFKAGRRREELSALAVKQVLRGTYDTKWRGYKEKEYPFYGYWEKQQRIHPGLT